MVSLLRSLSVKCAASALNPPLLAFPKPIFADAEMKGTEANVTLRLVSQLISATIDKDGKIVDGDREAVTEVKDVWTFCPRYPFTRSELEAGGH